MSPMPQDKTSDSLKTDNAGWVLATDLDGTLLDRQYDLYAAATAINTVCASFERITHCVLATSKTLAELEPLAALCNQRPILIFENGTGYAYPSSTANSYHSEVVGAPYGAIRDTLITLREQQGFDFQGFGDMTVSDLCKITALSEEGAALAKARGASEPLLWRDTDKRLNEFRQQLETLSLQLIRGGQFYHVSSPQTDKATALAAWKKKHATSDQLLACGDAPNDRQMLLMADHAIVFPGGEHGALLPKSKTTSHAQAAGPTAWLEAVQLVLNTFYRKPREP